VEVVVEEKAEEMLKEKLRRRTLQRDPGAREKVIKSYTPLVGIMVVKGL